MLMIAVVLVAVVGHQKMLYWNVAALDGEVCWVRLEEVVEGTVGLLVCA
jgi:hypothetical protein